MWTGQSTGTQWSDVTVNLDTRKGTGGDAMGDELFNIELVWGSDNNEEGEGDTFIASAGADLIHGDLGSDTVSYEASDMGVTVTYWMTIMMMTDLG